MRPSDILRRQLHNLVSNTNLWITPEHKDNNKEDNNMQVINITIIDEVTKGSIEASIIGCDNAYKRKEDNEVKTRLDVIFRTSDEILLFIKYAYEAGHKITLEGDDFGDTYKDMIVYSFGPVDKSSIYTAFIKIENDNKYDEYTKEQLIERIEDLETKLYGTCEMTQKIDLLIMRDCDLDSNTFKKLREIEKEYSKKLGMCLA